MTYNELLNELYNNFIFNPDTISINHSGTDDVKRGDVCYILHQLLKKILGEPDEVNIGKALYLEDLYQCQKCIGHIAQIYIKGIMAANTDTCFGVNELLSMDELNEICERIKDESKRFPIDNPGAKRSQTKIPDLEVSEVIKRIKSGEKIVFLDVRTLYDETPKIEGSINISFNKLLINPYVASPNKNDIIVTYCDYGYLSNLAANILIDHGYQNVYTASR